MSFDAWGMGFDNLWVGVGVSDLVCWGLWVRVWDSELRFRECVLLVALHQGSFADRPISCTAHGDN